MNILPELYSNDQTTFWFVIASILIPGILLAHAIYVDFKIQSIRVIELLGVAALTIAGTAATVFHLHGGVVGAAYLASSVFSFLVMFFAFTSINKETVIGNADLDMIVLYLSLAIGKTVSILITPKSQAFGSTVMLDIWEVWYWLAISGFIGLVIACVCHIIGVAVHRYKYRNDDTVEKRGLKGSYVSALIMFIPLAIQTPSIIAFI